MSSSADPLTYEYSSLTYDEMTNALMEGDNYYDEDVIITRNISDDCDYSIDDEPKDRFKIVQFTFLLLGLAPVLPWNFFITATDYWMYKFRDLNQTEGHISPNKTDLQTFFNSYLSMGSNFPFLVILIINAIWGEKIRESIRNLVSLFGTIAIFIIATVFTKINTDYWQTEFFTFTIILVILLSCFGAFLQGSTTGIASVFPSKCMHAIVNGQAISGIFAVIVQIISLAGHWKPANSAFYYFSIADFTLTLSLVMYLSVQRTVYYQFHLHKLNHSRRYLHSLPNSLQQPTGNNISTLFRCIWPHAVSVMAVFWVTLALYPPITILVVPRHPNTSPWTGRYFLPLACFLLFNSGDLAGRLISRFCPLNQKSKYLLLSFSLLRVILIPLIMVCNVQPRNYLPVLFENEIYYIVFMSILGLTNGYLFTNAMINGPNVAPEELKENAGFILVAFLGLGLTLGSFTSNILLRLL